MKGSEFIKQLWDVRIPMLSKLGLQEMLKGGMPDFLRNPMRCFTEAVIDGGYYKLTYYTLPNYLAIGTDDDYVLWPLSITDLQKFCDANTVTSVSNPSDTTSKFFIPPKKLVFNNWKFSECKIMPQALGASDVMTWPVKIKEEQEKINAAMKAAGCTLTTSCRAKKAYITAPNINDNDGPKRDGFLHFTGWYSFTPIIPNQRSVGTFQGRTVYAVQAGDETGGHESEYADYSHGCDLVYYNCDVNGMGFEFDEVCTHPKLHVLASDQGAFNPRYPNVGPNAKAPKTTTRMPPALGYDSSYQGPVYKTSASGQIVKMTTSEAEDGGTGARQDSEVAEASKGSSAGPLLIGGAAAVFLGYLLYTRRTVY